MNPGRVKRRHSGVNLQCDIIMIMSHEADERLHVHLPPAVESSRQYHT